MKSKENSENTTIELWRIWAFGIIIAVIFMIFIGRLFVFQIIEGEGWAAAAEENRTQIINLPTLRGVIYDRNGILLAKNIASYNVAITPVLLPNDDGEIEEIIRELSEFVSLPISRGSAETGVLLQCGDNLGITEMVKIGTSFSPYTPVLIDCDIERDLALAIQDMAIDWPGVSIEIEPIRDYPTGELTSTVIGFLGPIPERRQEELEELGFLSNRDKIGYAGIELYFDEILRGLNGRRTVEVDVAGEILRDIEGQLPAVDGLNVVLTIDTRLQDAADAIVKGEVDFWNTYLGRNKITSGVAIAINPQTGEILAMVSWPTYENNRFARFIPSYYYEQLILDATFPLQNNGVWGEIPAGSVFKIVTAVGALNEEVVTPEQIIQTPGQITIQNVYTPNDRGLDREFVDWNQDVGGFGELDFIGGISNSSNVYFYKLGGGFPPEIEEGGLGICRLGTYARALGYGSELGIELAEESDGLIPDPTWKRINQGENWSTGDTYIASVGQGFVIATPLQVLMSAATIANDGVLMRPTLVREIIDEEGKPVIVVMDQYGNLIQDISIDQDGNVFVNNVFKKEVTSVDAVLINAEGEIVNNFGKVYLDVDGNFLDFEIVQPFIESGNDIDASGNEILVFDLDGNSVPYRENEDGSITVKVYEETLESISLMILDTEGYIVEYPGDIFYDEDGDLLELFLMSPWAEDQKWDLTTEARIEEYSNPEGIGSCKLTGELSTIEPWVFEKVQEGMRAAVTSGTLEDEFEGIEIAVAGKTGTAEYCDVVALEKNLCIYGNWPTHAWTVAYAPFDNPEIAVVSFMYNGGEGASVAGPVVRKIIQSYFDLKAIDVTFGSP